MYVHSEVVNTSNIDSNPRFSDSFYSGIHWEPASLLALMASVFSVVFASTAALTAALASSLDPYEARLALALERADLLAEALLPPALALAWVPTFDFKVAISNVVSI